MSASQTPVLVVLAAGMGSRFGGDKQLAVLGSTGRTLLHFSVLDAYAAGVRDLVLIVRENIIRALEQQVLPHFPADLTVQLVLQNPADVPVEAIDLSNRQKPWGTAHALWSARQFLQHQPCIVINADDYYGRMAMQLLVQHFAKTDTEWAMVAFPLENTLSAHGGVNRGICQVNAGYLLCDRVFHLESRIHLQKVEVKMFIDNKFYCSCSLVITSFTNCNGSFSHFLT